MCESVDLNIQRCEAYETKVFYHLTQLTRQLPARGQQVMARIVYNQKPQAQHSEAKKIDPSSNRE